MKFVEYQDVSRNRIRQQEDHQILVNAHWHQFPCAIAPNSIVDNWQTQHGTIQLEDLVLLQNQYPADLIIIGSAHEPTWNSDWLMLQAKMHALGIGIEQMQRNAAIRTFNVLTTEDRPVWLVLP